MGNTQCFAESNDEQADKQQGRNRLQLNATSSELFLLSNPSSDTSTNDISQKNSKKLSCPFCQEILNTLQTATYSNEFRNCSSENNKLYILDLLNMKNPDFIYHPYLEQEILKIDSVQSLYRLKFPILIKDDITQITSSWFHLNLLQPKMIMELEDYEENSKEYQLFKELELLQHTKLSDLDQAILISLRWVLIENFCPQNLNDIFLQKIENKLLKRAYQLYQQIYHFCIAIKIKFESTYNQTKQVKAYDVLYIYVNLWNKYQEFMQTIIQQWDLLADGIQVAYKIQFDQQDDKIPHFKFHGIMARFWCQIILNDSHLQQILKQSYQKLLECIIVGEIEQIVSKQNTFQLFTSEQQILEIMKLFVNSIVDVSVEEASVHVIGHSKYYTIHEIFIKICQISDILIDYRIYDEKGFGLESFLKGNQIISKFQTIYPQWYFDKIEEKCYERLTIIKNKILLKPKQSKQEIKIDKSTEFLNEKLSQIGKQAGSYTQNTASTNFIQLSQKTVTMSTNDTQKATTTSVFNTLLFDSSETTLQSQQIIHSDLTDIIEKVEQRREQVRINKEYRERIIESRCQKYNIPIERKLKDLNFFKSKDLTDLTKLSPKMKDGMKILVEQRIKKIRSNKDLNNKQKCQLENFEKYLKS